MKISWPIHYDRITSVLEIQCQIAGAVLVNFAPRRTTHFRVTRAIRVTVSRQGCVRREYQANYKEPRFHRRSLAFVLFGTEIINQLRGFMKREVVRGKGTFVHRQVAEIKIRLPYSMNGLGLS